MCNPLRSLTPAGPARSGRTARRCCERVSSRRSLPRLVLSRLDHEAVALPVYASQRRLPARHATLGSGGGHRSRAAIDPLQGSSERFQFFVHPPLPGLPGARACHRIGDQLWIIGLAARTPPAPIRPTPPRRLGAHAGASPPSLSSPLSSPTGSLAGSSGDPGRAHSDRGS